METDVLPAAFPAVYRRIAQTNLTLQGRLRIFQVHWHVYKTGACQDERQHVIRYHWPPEVFLSNLHFRNAIAEAGSYSNPLWNSTFRRVPNRSMASRIRRDNSCNTRAGSRWIIGEFGVGMHEAENDLETARTRQTRVQTYWVSGSRTKVNILHVL